MLGFCETRANCKFDKSLVAVLEIFGQLSARTQRTLTIFSRSLSTELAHLRSLCKRNTSFASTKRSLQAHE